MIRVGKLDIQNVGPFKKQEFDLSIEKGNPDVHIFIGPNGTGKTTILHAIASGFDYFEPDHKEHLSNSFYKRFHFFEYDDEKSAYSLKSHTKTTVLYKDNYSELNRVTTYGCSSCDKIHQIKNVLSEKKLAEYQRAIISEDISTQSFKFGVFGYSGYRLISSAKIQLGNELKFNPLHLALEFVKKNDENANISNWIISRYSKAAIEETHGNKELAQKYREALNCLMDSINDLTDGQYSFEIKTNPWKVITKHYDKEVEFDVLPDGLRSLLSWMGDLLMRLDAIPWENKEIPVNEQDLILLLDEIEVHLHPTWQYKVLPLTQKIFPNAQIIITTHSPFIINSIDNAKIYKLKIDEQGSQLEKVILSETGDSYAYVYENILDTTHKFGPATTKDLERFNIIDKEIMQNKLDNEAEFQEIVKRLKKEGEEVTTIISSKLFRLKNIKGKDYLNGENQ